jgi:3-hydroxyisobutyrate dehydrogenase
MSTRVAFIGVGTMGKHMARNLLRAGYPVTVFDIQPAPLEELRTEGAAVAVDARECAARGEVTITMLPSSPDVEAAVLGPNGALAGMARGATLIEMSTIDPLVSQRVAAEAEACGVRMLDAPVSGGSTGARDATLTIMVGGPPDLLESCRPILETLGRTILHCGAAGMGEMVKVVNNLIVGVSMAAVAEAFNIGLRAGVEPRILYEVVSQSSGRCWVLEHIPPYPGLVPDAPANVGFEPGFMVDLMRKDLGLAMSAAQGLGAPSLMAAVAHELFSAASNLGYGRRDQSAVVKAVEALSRPLADGDR